MNTLCNLYDELGYYKKKRKLLDRIVAIHPKSPLRAGAWQRLATIFMDDRDASAAWNAFLNAQRDNPDSLDIGVLELHLLVADNKIEHVKQRAKFWIKRLQKQGYYDDEPPLDHLLEMAKDPIGALANIGMEITGGAGERLRDWLAAVAHQPVPRYELRTHIHQRESVADKRHKIYKRRSRGSLKRARAPTPRQLELFAKKSAPHFLSAPFPSAEPELQDEFLAHQQKDFVVLVPPQGIATLNRRWHRIFPLEKPFSVYNETIGHDYAWDFEIEDAWMQYLQNHPQAFDSLDILDDLATALVQHPHYGSEWLDHTLLAPVLERANAIIEHSLSGHTDVNIAWLLSENRPALRSLARLSALYSRLGDAKAERQLMELLLKLNPNDNHGYRGAVINAYLRSGDNEKALILANRYPNDVQAETTYGRVLALYRLNRNTEAEKMLCDAIEQLPKVAHHLTHERVKKPKLDPHGVSYGGHDQAWIYREDMRDVWKATPGLIEWIKRAYQQYKGMSAHKVE